MVVRARVNKELFNTGYVQDTALICENKEFSNNFNNSAVLTCVKSPGLPYSVSSLALRKSGYT